MEDKHGQYNVVEPRSHGRFSTPPTDVLVKWHGGQRTLVEGVTHGYVTGDGRLTLMSGRKATRISLSGFSKKYRKGRIEYTFDQYGGLDFHVLHVIDAEGSRF